MWQMRGWSGDRLFDATQEPHCGVSLSSKRRLFPESLGRQRLLLDQQTLDWQELDMPHNCLYSAVNTRFFASCHSRLQFNSECSFVFSILLHASRCVALVRFYVVKNLHRFWAHFFWRIVLLCRKPLIVTVDRVSHDSHSARDGGAQRSMIRFLTVTHSQMWMEISMATAA